MAYDSMAIGEILVDFVPKFQGPPVREGAFEAHLGGAPFNYLVDLSRLGGRGAGIGAVGEDPFGEMLLSSLSSEGVSTKYVLRKPHRTSLAFVLLSEGGERSFFFYRSPRPKTADTELRPEEVPEEISEAKVLHVSGMALSVSPLRDAVHRAIEVANSSGVLVSFDFNVRPEVWGSKEEMIEEYGWALGHSDIIGASCEDLLFLFGDHPEEASKRLYEKCSPEVFALKKGSEGVVIFSDGKEIKVEAFEVEAVDSTGAGDAWMATFNFYFAILGKDLEEAALMANGAGAIVCMHRGATEGFPRRKELEKFVFENLR